MPLGVQRVLSNFLVKRFFLESNPVHFLVALGSNAAYPTGYANQQIVSLEADLGAEDTIIEALS